MTASIVVQPEAETDLDNSYRWYEERRAGLGQEFLVEVDRAFCRIAESPLRPKERYRGTRRVALRRFPYVVLYLAQDDQVFVLGVLHERRSPARFRARTSSRGRG